MSSKCPVLYQERQIEVPRLIYIYKMTQSMCEYMLCEWMQINVLTRFDGVPVPKHDTIVSQTEQLEI